MCERRKEEELSYFVNLWPSQSREMKSINVNELCQYVKLSVHSNHVNPLNLYSQVHTVCDVVLFERKALDCTD